MEEEEGDANFVDGATLGSGMLVEDFFTGVCTLGSATVSDGGDGKCLGIASLRLSRCATFKSAFLVVSPACNTGPFSFNGTVKSLIMSEVACRMKSSVVTLG